eukprot:13980803-Ditylum_brightwellii.AAC.1
MLSGCPAGLSLQDRICICRILCIQGHTIVINHCSVGTYAYGCTKDVHYCSYIRWKFKGIPNPGCGNGSKGQTGTPNMG